jgi:putative membrane protein insertion efficiency factor
MRKVILKLIAGYKKHISRGKHCRFVPSCSEYAYEAVKKYGAVKGLYLSVKRVLRCNPFNKGGVDLLE